MLTIAVLCSHHAPGLMHLLTSDRERGRSWNIAACVTSELTFAEEVRASRRGVPARPHPIAEFYAARGASIHRDAGVRAEYDAQTIVMLEPYAPDLVLLLGYSYLVTEPMLRAYDGRLLNLHFADLTARFADGRPCFPGTHAVRDALFAGQTETRATVHLVNTDPCGGAPIVKSWPFSVSPLVRAARMWNAHDMFKAYVFAHQQWMIRDASGPLLSAALKLVTAARVSLPAVAAAPPEAAVPWELAERGLLLSPLSHEPVEVG